MNDAALSTIFCFLIAKAAAVFGSLQYFPTNDGRLFQNLIKLLFARFWLHQQGWDVRKKHVFWITYSCWGSTYFQHRNIKMTAGGSAESCGVSFIPVLYVLEMTDALLCK